MEGMVHLSATTALEASSVAAESLVDVTTTVFEAILGVCVVFAAGYAYNAKLDVGSGQVSPVPLLLPLNH
jgi:hypothetical protein